LLDVFGEALGTKKKKTTRALLSLCSVEAIGKKRSKRHQKKLRCAYLEVANGALVPKAPEAPSS